MDSLKNIFSVITLLVFAALALPLNALALSGGDVSFALTSDDSAGLSQELMIDSNNCPTDGPSAMYITGKVTNTSASDLVDFSAQMTNLSAGLSLAGGQADTISLGTLASGASKMVGWLVQYSCNNGQSETVDIIMSDDNAGTVSSTLNLTVRDAISSNAGGQVTSSLLGPGAIVGQTITMDVTYEFGGAAIGDDYFLQPTGTSAFNAGCFALVGSQIMSSNVTAVPVGILDDLHFIATSKQSGSGYDLTVRYFFKYLCANTSTTARPFAAQTSGASNLKYTGNFDGAGSVFISYPGATNPFTISKTATPDSFDVGVGGTATYTVSISNPSIYDSYVDKITDTLPAGVIFAGLTVASNVTASNSNSVPTVGATGTLEFEGNAGSSYFIAGGTTLDLVYTATIPGTQGTYSNSAFASIGLAVTGTVTENVFVGAAELSASKSNAVYDPLTEGLYAIPGNDIIYTIDFANIGSGPVDADTVVIIDNMPAEIEFYNGDIDDGGPETDPVIGIDNGSGLSLDYASDVAYSNVATKPADFASCTYTPSAGYDPNVTFICFNPSGAMAAGDPDPSFQVQLRARIK